MHPLAVTPDELLPLIERAHAACQDPLPVVLDIIRDALCDEAAGALARLGVALNDFALTESHRRLLAERAEVRPLPVAVRNLAGVRITVGDPADEDLPAILPLDLCGPRLAELAEIDEVG